jgi:hypothetical protein
MLNGHVAQNPLAFFPLFPFLLRTLSLAHHIPVVVVGVVLTTLLGATAVWAVAGVAHAWRGPQIARRVGIFFALSPGAVAFCLLYSEGLFLSLAALSLWAMLRERWWLAGCCALLASATSALGLCLAGALLVEVIARRRSMPTSLIGGLTVAPLGFVGYMGFLYAYTGQWNAWLLTEHDGWHSYFDPLYPVTTVLRFFRNPAALTLNQHMLLWCTIVGIVALVWAWRSSLPRPCLVYVTCAVVLSACSYPVGLRPRFLLCAFPLLFAPAATASRRQWGWMLVVAGLGLIAMTMEEFLSFAIFP